jgi:hypothetical protein
MIAEQGKPDASWTEFLDVLTGNPKDGGYGIYDMHVTTKDDRKLQKIIFVAWAPDSGLVRFGFCFVFFVFVEQQHIN